MRILPDKHVVVAGQGDGWYALLYSQVHQTGIYAYYNFGAADDVHSITQRGSLDPIESA